MFDIIELIQSSDTEFPNLLLSRTASLRDMETHYTDGLLHELQGTLHGTVEVLRLKLLDQLRLSSGHQLLERCDANELKEIVRKIAREDQRITDTAAKLHKTKTLLASQNMGLTTGRPN